MSKRMIDTDLWNNEEIIENFTAEDKYFWLYLLTSPHNNICGVFKNSPTLIARDMGLHKDTIVNLLYRFENVHKLVYADKDTNEVLILNWYKFNWNKSPKLRILIDNEFAKITSETISILLAERIGKIFGQDTVSIPYPYPTISNPISISNSIDNDILQEKNKDDDYNMQNLTRLLSLYPQIQNDITNTAFVDEPNYDLIIEMFDKSEYLRTKCFQLSWVIKNHIKIESGFYSDKPKQDQTPSTTVEWVQDETGVWKPKL